MHADQPYFRYQLKDIPKVNLEAIVSEEIMSLMYDCGQKCTPGDQDAQYMIGRTVNILRGQYPEWKLSYLDECFRKGKLDEFDKGQKITQKRLEVWFSGYGKALKFSVWAKRQESAPDDFMRPEFAAKFAANAERFAPIIEFRQAYKPNFDAEEWTLLKIEQTPEYAKWIKAGFRAKKQTTNLIFTKI